NPTEALSEPNAVVLSERIAGKYFGERISSGRKSGSFSSDKDAWQLHLQPLTAVHLDPDIKWGLAPTGNSGYSYILTAIAFVILLIACINFVSLAIARSTGRAKEVGLRKVMGAAKKQLVKQYLGEALLLSFIALAAGVFLAELSLPVFNRLANLNLAFDSANISSLLILLIALMLSISFLAGGYPALLLSRFQPVMALQQRLKLGGNNMLGKSLVVFQFLLSVFLIISAFVMSQQLDFLKHKDLGYNAGQVVAIPTYMLGERQQTLAEIYKQEIGRNEKVLHISGVNNSFTRGMMTSDVRSRDTSVEAWFYFVHDDFLETLEIKVAQGRDFSKELQTDVRGSVIVNEALIDYFGWDEPLGRQPEMLDGHRPTIIGVVKNFHFRSLHNQVDPAVIVLHPGLSNSNILVKINRNNITETLAFLEQTWKKVAPHAPFEFYFFDEDVQEQYLADERWANIVRNAATLAVIIACLGLFGLAALAATQRTKEIGIRKVLGATVANVVTLLSKDFVKLVLLANLIAWPVAWYAMNRWLENFAYRIEIGWWVFALAGGLALVIALLTVSTQAIRAALANPVESLRYE
ncbi:MAG: FtsX-like permease family protein, partial [bacterium]